MMKNLRRDELDAGTWSGAVTLLRARHGSGRKRVLRDLGWSRIAPGGVHVIDVEGDHETMLKDEVASTAAALKRVLAAAREREERSVRINSHSSGRGH
jgi:hypothetical protein